MYLVHYGPDFDRIAQVRSGGDCRFLDDHGLWTAWVTPTKGDRQGTWAPVDDIPADLRRLEPDEPADHAVVLDRYGIAWQRHGTAWRSTADGKHEGKWAEGAARRPLTVLICKPNMYDMYSLGAAAQASERYDDVDLTPDIRRLHTTWNGLRWAETALRPY